MLLVFIWLYVTLFDFIWLYVTLCDIIILRVVVEENIWLTSSYYHESTRIIPKQIYQEEDKKREDFPPLNTRNTRKREEELRLIYLMAFFRVDLWDSVRHEVVCL